MTFSRVMAITKWSMHRPVARWLDVFLFARLALSREREAVRLSQPSIDAGGPATLVVEEAPGWHRVDARANTCVVKQTPLSLWFSSKGEHGRLISNFQSSVGVPAHSPQALDLVTLPTAGNSTMGRWYDVMLAKTYTPKRTGTRMLLMPAHRESLG